MYEFGEEVIIESYKVPWLIWIQLLVMILLVLLLFFGFSILELPNNSSSIASSSESPTGVSHGNTPSNSTSTLQHWNQNQHIKGETEASTSREIARADEFQEKEGSAEKDTNIFKLLVRPQHPCNYFGLAKQAFLKCLGFDSDRDNCNTRRHAKED
ncbi:uncharacterized protein LOC132614477 isoform X1 [Lycium barbarum]|uniref:uncharacterized protein LOC132059426 isoform X1 n=1 Tax=Lycium ferocissimum TaxID=112874 RepID=UPI00281515C7|nr:uncharacterized protein LOC132059426 isoform X1 [Lycium ferocissimum]XP_060184916.1 uncharacterized protein LOC132614477 isoform X1 [Lycium barbarum]XP_060184917.1 uncharacterized protein LOC132614477 isoform X1 [Lycium barbarum]